MFCSTMSCNIYIKNHILSNDKCFITAVVYMIKRYKHHLFNLREFIKDSLAKNIFFYKCTDSVVEITVLGDIGRIE